MTLREAALDYLVRGFSIFPCKSDKRPLLPSWLPYQDKAPTVEQVQEWWKNGNSSPIALVTGKVSGIVVVDVDDVSVGLDNLSKYIPSDTVTPTVRTPTGGLHFYFSDPGIDVRNNARAIPGCDFRGNGGYVIAPPSHCEYKKAGKDIAGDYTWVRALDEVPLAELPASYISCINSLAFSLYKGSVTLSPDPSEATSQNVTHITSSHYFQEGVRDEQLFHLANILVKGGGEIPFVREVLTRIVNSWGEHDLKWVETKIKSAMERAGRMERNITQELRDWVASQTGTFRVTDWSQDSQNVTKQGKHAARVACQRLVEEGKLRKTGVKAGEYEIVDDTLTKIDFQNVEDKEVDLVLPFHIERFVKIYPKNLIVVAGEPNAGKTGFLLNIARDNQAKHEIHYFSSEMGPLETKVRLEKFPMFPLSAWTTNFWERASDFADVLRPDAVNIVDFLEIHDEFWKVGRLLKEIFDKLNKGVAIVALQKNPSRKMKDGTQTGEVGLGGFRGLEKPRLYLTMGNHVLKIVKAKNWRTEENPNGKSIRFRIAGGCHFTQDGGWYKEDDKYAGLVREPGCDD